MAETKAEVSLEEYLNNLFSAKGVMVPLTLEEWTGGWVTIVGGINGKPTAQQFNKVFYVLSALAKSNAEDEVIGAGGATTTGGTPTNIDLIHAGLLSCSRALFSNSTDSAKKGWPEANIRTWLQKRYMSALPAALREMLEEVKIKSVIYGDGTSAGAKTIESSDKVYLPSKQDMFGGTTAPYTECGKQIPWIISNPTRVRFRGLTARENYTYTSGSLPDDPAVGDVCYYSNRYCIWNGHIWVNAQYFWLRDAYPTSTYYSWYVSYFGYYDYYTSTNSYGIMPRLHL